MWALHLWTIRIWLHFRMDDFNITDDEIFTDMQESIDRWEEGLKMTGGAIVPNKSWVYPIAFDFLDDGLWRYKSMEENDFQFSVKDHRGIRQILTQFEVDLGTKTLGAILAPDGNNKGAVRHLRNIAEKWYSLVKTGHLQPDETFLATNSRIMKSISYCLPAMTFTQKECNYIQAPVMKASLQKSHVCSTFPRAVAFGPVKELGLGYQDLYSIQGASQLNTIVQYLPMQSDITGNLLRSNFESARIDVGLGGDFFMYDYKDFSKHFTCSWLKSVWSFIDTHNISFSESITGEHSLKRENDQFIMFKIIQLSKYGATQLRRINACRLYLQVYALSDIATGDGLRFTQESWLCLRDSSRRTRLVWPNQPRPNEKTRKLWRQAIKLAFPRNAQSRFIEPLGRWTDLPSRELCTWFFFEPTSSTYKRFGAEWRKYTRTTQRGQLGQFPSLRYECNAMSLPLHSVRATVEQVNNTLRLTGWAEDIRTLRNTNVPLSFKYQQSVGKAIVNMKTDYQYINCTEEDIVRHISQEELSVVSDGSFLSEAELSTAAWVIAISRNQYKIGRHWVTGNDTDHCSHRAELSGLLGGILDINTICVNHEILEGNARFFCDGLGAVNMVSYIRHKLSPSHSHFDIIHSLFQAIQRSPIKWTFHHVYGHQDDNIDVHDLSDESFYNTLADEHAKRKLSEIMAIPNYQTERPFLLPYRLCTIHYTTMDGSVISLNSKFSHTLINLIATDRIHTYWREKGVHPSHTRYGFSRKIAGKAMVRLSGNQRRWVSKWCTGICGSGVNLLRWKQQDHSNCPRCLLPNETAVHSVQCQHPEATELWNNLLLELNQWMLNSRGHPHMVEVLCLSLTSWRNNTPYAVIQSHYEEQLQKAINDQHILGWGQLFYGIWSTFWIRLQQQHFQSLGSKKSAETWIATVQQKLWLLAFNMWDHRNKVLHNTRHSIFPHEMAAIDSEITQEMQVGSDNLPQSQRYLFLGTAQEKLRWNISMKIQWLISIRRSRNWFYPLRSLPLPIRSDTVNKVIERWHRKGNVRL